MIRPDYSIYLIVLVILSACQPDDPARLYRPLILQYVNIWNTGDFTGIEALLHPDFELRMTPKFEAEAGIELFKENVSSWRQAYPDFTIRLDELVFAESAVSARWTITATNTGEGRHPSTGKAIEVLGLSIIHVLDGKIKDEWIASNNLYWLQQLGFTLKTPFESESP